MSGIAYGVPSNTIVTASLEASVHGDRHVPLDQLVYTAMLGDTGHFEYTFPDEITIQPGESITIAAKAVSGSPSWVIASINTREDS